VAAADRAARAVAGAAAAAAVAAGAAAVAAAASGRTSAEGSADDRHDESHRGRDPHHGSRPGDALMLSPKRVKFRKQHRGRRAGLSRGQQRVEFGEYGLKSLEAGWLTNRQIE